MSFRSFYQTRLFETLALHAPTTAIHMSRLAARFDFAREPIPPKTILKNNFQRAFPDITPDMLDALCQRHKKSLYEMSALYKHLSQADAKRLFAHTDCDIRYLDQTVVNRIINHPGPVVVFTPHYGAFLSVSLKLVRDIGASKRFNFLFEDPEKNPGNAEYPKIYSRMGSNVTSLLNNRRSIVTAVKSLQKGEALGMLPDVYNAGNNHIAVPFFGRLTNAMTGTAFFAVKTQALLVPLYCYPEGGMRYVLDVQEPIPLSTAEDFEQALYETTSAIFANIEAQLLRLPEHWIYWQDLHQRYPCAARVPAHSEADWHGHFDLLLKELRAQAPSLTPLLDDIERKTRKLDSGSTSTDYQPL